MQSLTRALFVLLMTMVLVLSGCSKSVEGETKKWKANEARITALSAQYPGFKAALDARKESASKLYKEADGLDGDAKIKKLAEANTALMTGFVRELDGLDGELKELREKRVEAAAKAGDKSSLLGAKVAAEDAQKTIERVDSTLKTGAKDEASATAVLKKITADIETAQSAIDKVLAIDKEKQDAKASDAKADADAKAAEKAAADAKVAPWKCEYCDNMNKHDSMKCESCGAARPEDKKDAKAPTK
ncbi:MAG: hypothetical protein H6713_27820 [Myxococcales bacterium]|nr:hypothetical protein [Myxococcales bacterium]